MASAAANATVDDAALRARLELVDTWGGCEEAVRRVREEWPVDVPPGVVIMRDAGLRALPEELFAYCRRRVTMLDVSGNHELAVLPASVGRLIALKRLIAYNCCIAEVPASLSACTELVEISLSGTQVTALPNEVLMLPRLLVLGLRDCLLSASALCTVADLAVRRSETLFLLSVQSNPGSRDIVVAEAFACALRSNGTLATLNITDEDGRTETDPPGVGTAIVAAIERNRRDEPPPEPYAPLVKAARQ